MAVEMGCRAAHGPSTLQGGVVLSLRQLRPEHRISELNKSTPELSMGPPHKAPVTLQSALRNSFSVCWSDGHHLLHFHRGAFDLERSNLRSKLASLPEMGLLWQQSAPSWQPPSEIPILGPLGAPYQLGCRKLWGPLPAVLQSHRKTTQSHQSPVTRMPRSTERALRAWGLGHNAVSHSPGQTSALCLRRCDGGCACSMESPSCSH